MAGRQLLSLASLALLIFQSQALKSQPFPNFGQTWFLDAGIDIYMSDDLATADDSFVFVSCPDGGSLSKKHSDCNITLHTVSIDNGKSRDVTCSLGDYPVSSAIVSKSLGHILRSSDNKISIIWFFSDHDVKNTVSVRLQTLIMSNCSYVFGRTYSFSGSELTDDMPVEMYGDGSFDVFLTNGTRVSFDKNGAQIGEPVAFQSDLRDIEVKSYGSPVKGYWVNGHKGNSSTKFFARIVAKDGSTQRELMHVDNSPTTTYLTSNSHDMYGLCTQNNLSMERGVNCAQFDRAGNTKLKVSLAPMTEDIRAVYNLANGGMLLFSSQGKEVMRARKIGVDGVRGKPFDVDFGSFGSIGVNEIADEYRFHLAGVEKMKDEKNLPFTSLNYNIQRRSKEYINNM